MLIAAHDWDGYGALFAGLRAAFIKRSRQYSYSLSLKPELEIIISSKPIINKKQFI